MYRILHSTYPDEYSPPTKDAVQKLDNPIAYYSDGYLTLTFTHKRISYDIYEFNLTDTDCYYFIFPVEGGSFVNDLGVINKPYQTPKLSDDLICFHEIQGLVTVTMIHRIVSLCKVNGLNFSALPKKRSITKKSSEIFGVKIGFFPKRGHSKIWPARKEISVSQTRRQD